MQKTSNRDPSSKLRKASHSPVYLSLPSELSQTQTSAFETRMFAISTSMEKENKQTSSHSVQSSGVGS